MRDSSGSDRDPGTWRHGRWLALGASVAMFVLYLFSLAPGIGPEDAGEFVTAAVTLGIPHPPGFPLYVLLGFPFAHLPGFSSAIWLNVLSAIAGSVTVFYLARTLQIVRVSPVVATVTAIAFGVTGVFWAQAVVAEVYTLTLALLAAAVYCLVRWVQVPVPDLPPSSGDREGRGAARWLYGFAVLAGGALSVHPYLALTVAPVAIAILVWYRSQHPHSTRQWMAAGAFLLLGLTPYLFLPIRSAMNPALDWGNPERLSSLIAHVSRSDYGDLELSAADAAGRYDLLGSFLTELWTAYTPFFVSAGIIGLWWVIRTRNALLLLLSFGIVVNTVAVLFFRDQPSGLDTSYIYRPYYLVSFFLFALLVGKGLEAVGRGVHSLIGRSAKAVRTAGMASLILAATAIPVVATRSGWDDMTAAHRPYVSEYAGAVLASLPQDTVLVVKAPGLHLDTLIFGLMHAQAVEHLRPDVTVLTLVQAPGFFPAIPDAASLPRDYYTRSFVEQEFLLLEHAFREYGSSRPIYTTFTTDRWPGSTYVFRSNGLVYRAMSDAMPAGAAETLVSLEGMEQLPAAQDPFTRQIRTHVSYARAAYFIEQGDRAQQLNELLRAIDADPEAMSHVYLNFVAHRDTLDRALRAR